MKKMYLSVIIPCYNEEENLKRKVLDTVWEFMKKKDYNWEVIVSDDGSTDNSKKIVKNEIKDKPNFKLKENPHGGKPSALLFGVKAAKGKYVLFADMDQSTPISEVDKLLKKTNKNTSVVIGSRGLQREDNPLYRKLGAMVFMAIRRSMILSELKDTQCGFKLFRKDVLAKAFPRLEFFKNSKIVKGWVVTSYDVELLHIIKKMGEKIREVEVVWKDEDTSVTKGSAIGKYIKESKEMFFQILRIKINDIRGMYS